MILAAQVILKGVKRVQVAVLLFFHNNMVALEKRVCLVRWEVEFILVIGDGNSGPFYNFLPVTKADFIGKCEFAKVHECKESG